MPEQPLVTQPPRSLLLPEHVDKGVHVQPDQKSQTTETQTLGHSYIQRGWTNYKCKTTKAKLQVLRMWPAPPCTTSADTKHHTGPKYSLRDVDLPVISAAIQNPEISFQFERDQILDQGLFGNCHFKGMIINVHLVPRTPAVPLDQFGWKCAILCFGPYSRTCAVSCMIRLSKSLTHLM